MSGFLGVIRSNNGFVIISDIETDNHQNTATIQINSNCVVGIFRGNAMVKDFLDKYVIPKNPQTVLDAFNLIKFEIEKHSVEYVQSNFSFFLLGYENRHIY